MSDVPLFDTVLVANRGEIARRVIRTLRRLGIRSVAVYSDADADAPHVREADEAVRIGEAAAARSYLSIDALIAAAQVTGAQAVHPGYGFLSESAAFGAACAAAGIVFIGPGERALEVMADKIRARDHVAAHGVPIVPGFSAAALGDDKIAARAADVGFPLLVKPSAGGGGKGMEVVTDAAALPAALETARRVARAAFGDDTLLLERLVTRPRHIEVQVLADAHGAVIHLGERECTLQRRHQKVVEEAPSPAVDEALRARLGAAAVAAAASVDYRGAGTVEFLVSADRPEDFFFIEMNTRLQVEHPVTEAVTGIDLVEQQLRIAAGEQLHIAQSDVVLDGHAVEARVYAESPERGFLPATGAVVRWLPAPGVRTDAAVETGSHVTTDYDPMIAKVIAHAPTRAAALAALDRGLRDTVLLGVESNIGFLRDLIALPAVVAGDLDTGIIERMPPPVPRAPTEAALRVAAAAAPAPGATEPAFASPLWRAGSGWRASAPAVVAERAFATADGDVVAVRPAPVTGESARDADGTVWVHTDDGTWALTPLSRRAADERRRARRERGDAASDPRLAAPMPGTVVAVHHADGDAVTAGTRIVTIEAMKMEHPLTAPHDGTVHLDVAVGDQVRLGQVLARVDPHPEGTP